jgi:hypothetical protein
MSYKCLINSVISPNLVSSRYNMTIYFKSYGLCVLKCRLSCGCANCAWKSLGQKILVLVSRDSWPYFSVSRFWETCSLTLNTMLPSKSKIFYDWRFTAIQFVLAPSPWGSRSEIFFQLNPCGHSPNVTSSLIRGWGCLLWICLAFCQVYVLYIYHVIENSSFCTIHKSSVSPVLTKQIMLILLQLS